MLLHVVAEDVVKSLWSLFWNPGCDEDVSQFWLSLYVVVVDFWRWISQPLIHKWRGGCKWKSMIVVGLIVAGKVSVNPWSPGGAGGAGGPPAGAPATEEPLPPGWEMRWDQITKFYEIKLKTKWPIVHSRSIPSRQSCLSHPPKKLVPY